MNISYFQNIADKRPVTIGIESLVEKIRNGNYADLVERVRSVKNDEDRTKAKKRLPAVTVSGIFEGGHKAEQLVSHSGLIQIDFDKVDDAAVLKEKLVTDPYTLVAFVSPSGTGVKAMVRIPTSDNRHWIKCLAEYYREMFDAFVDEQCCDTSRLCFVSHDTDAYYNPDAKVFDIAKCKGSSDSDKPSKNGSGNTGNTFELFQKAVTRKDKKGAYAQGNRNTYVFNLACQCHSLGIAQSEAERLITDNFDLPRKETETAVKSAYSYPTDQRVTAVKKAR